MSLEIWELFETTDTSFTKRQTTGAKLMSINPQYQIKRFTEEFGPCGVDWGFDIVESFFVEGAPMMKREVTDNEGNPIDFGPCKIHTVRVKLWFKLEGDPTIHDITGTGHTPFVYMTSYGPTTDMEYEKKSVTDGLTKAMSLLGMCADVRMGQFEDSDYVQGLQRDEALNGAVDKEAEKIKQRQEFEAWLETNLELMRTSTALRELEVIFKSGRIRVDAQGTTRQKEDFTNMKNNVARDLMKKQREAEAAAEAKAKEGAQ